MDVLACILVAASFASSSAKLVLRRKFQEVMDNETVEDEALNLAKLPFLLLYLSTECILRGLWISKLSFVYSVHASCKIIIWLNWEARNRVCKYV